MPIGSITGFLRTQGVTGNKAIVVKCRFQSWLRGNARKPVVIKVRRNPPTNVYEFAALASAWADYRAMRISKGYGVHSKD
jgi:hypothetical protein